MRVGITLFALVWCGVTVGMDWYLVSSSVRVVQSGGWATADGVVTRCEMVRGGKSSHLELAYTFTVAGREYTGRDYEPGIDVRPSGKWPTLLATYPVGTKVTVYHNPTNPADAVLKPGETPEVLGLPLLLTPVNLSAVAVFLLWWRTVIQPRRFDPERHVRPTADGMTARLNGLTRLEGFGLVLITLCVIGIVGPSVLLNSTLGMSPPWWLHLGVWVLAVAFSVLVAWKWGGPRVLVEGVDALTLPTTPTGSTTVEVPRADVVWADVRVDTRRGKRGTYDVYVAVVVTEVGKSRHEVRFAEYSDRRDGEALAGWLRGRLGLGNDR